MPAKIPESNPLYEFGEFQLDRARRALYRRDGGRQRIGARAFDALCVLIDRRGELVDKATLLSVLWPNALVEENSLTQCISSLRRTLGEKPGECRFVMTIPRRGYQFIAEVSTREPARLPRPTEGSQSTQSYDCYLQAQSLLTRPTDANLNRAVRLFRQVIARNERFARAYLGLAHAQHMRVVFDFDGPRVLTEIQHNAHSGVALDPQLAQGHAILGTLDAYRGRWQDAERHFRTALAIEPRDPQIILPYAMNLLVSPGYLHKALGVLRDAYAITPALSGFAASLSMVCMLLDLNDEANNYARMAATLGWRKDLSPLSDSLSQLAIRAGRFAEASAAIEADLPAQFLKTDGLNIVRSVFEALGEPSKRGRAVRALHRLESKVPSASPGQLMRRRLVAWYTQLGDLDSAFDTANKSLAHFANVGIVGTLWGFVWMREMNAFRRDRRFQSIAARVNFEEIWKRSGFPDAKVAGKEI